MGWKGTVRSVRSAYRAADRDAKRHQRELAQQQKQLDKMQELEQAAHEVDVYQNYIDLIQSLHKECGDQLDWEAIASAPEPIKPTKNNDKERQARIAEEKYKPGIIDKALKRENKMRTKLSSEISKAIEDDKSIFNTEVSKYAEKYKSWLDNIEFARLLMSGDQEAKIQIITELNPFSEISELGSSLSFKVNEGSVLEATVKVHSDEVIPNESKSLLASGRLSTKKMPKGQFNELYQDYVCSCVLRVANELFSILTDDLVMINAMDKLLNTKTGHHEESPIVSILVSRSTIKSMNMDRIDPSDSMENFVHNMSFKKTKGFEAVEYVTHN